MFGMTIIGRGWVCLVGPLLEGGGYVWCDHYYLLIFVCSANNSITCIVLQDFWLAEKGLDGRWGRREKCYILSRTLQSS